MTADTDDTKMFLDDRLRNIKLMSRDEKLNIDAKKVFVHSFSYKYPYNFDWLGLPIIQFPQDIIAVQEIIWKTKPDIIIETGVARGGSLILSASILHLLNGNGRVIGIDIDIRAHNRKVIENHPLAFRIDLIQGSSIDQSIVDEVKKQVKQSDKVMVILDSNHTHDHVLKELELYSSLVTKSCYLVVMDTIIDDMPDDSFSDRPWGIGNNPKTAVHEFLKKSDRFEIDESIHDKLLITVAPDGYLKCISVGNCT
jgi:cephalosporin hydroxylase